MDSGGGVPRYRVGWLLKLRMSQVIEIVDLLTRLTVFFEMQSSTFVAKKWVIVTELANVKFSEINAVWMVKSAIQENLS